jgi:hypothetical protein
MRAEIRGLGALGIAVCALAATAAAANANAATIGRLAPGRPPVATGTSSPFDLIQATVTRGRAYVVPAGGSEITSWSTNAAAGAGQQLKFKVFRPISGSQWKVVGSDLEALTGGAVNTFAVSMPVQPGDVIGLDDGNASSSVPDAADFGSAVTGMLIGNGDLATGSIGSFYPTDGQANVTAQVSGSSTGPPPPPISKIHEHPKAKLTTTRKQTRVRFSFSANEVGVAFRCKLDKAKFSSCTSPKTYKVGPGKHKFSVEATNTSGRTGRGVSFRFKVVHG